MELLGIDIGGSGIKGAIVDVETGKLVSERIRIPTPQPAKPKAVAKVVQELINDLNWNGPVGVCFPTVIKNGKALQYGNLHKSWKNKQIDKLFKECCANDFYVLNDADSAAMAVMKFGAGRDKKGLVITITIGTGLGSGVFYNGQLLPNFELGRIYGKQGDIMESFAADSARKREDLNYKEFGRRINFFLTHLEQTMRPEIFIIGGGISKNLDKFEKYLTLETPVIPAQLLNDAGIIGAAMFALENIK
ncbi:MAG: ROK family protein [Flavobacteriaceae bacterium]|nr:ROK family protein [Bacteroidia bacterium]NNL16925.1 ROK family protein [Flavobacteriaceae bacterium]